MHFAHVRKFDRSIGRKRTASKVLGWFPKTQWQLMGSVTKLENPSSFRGSGWNIWYPHPILNYPLHRLKNGRWKVLPTCKSVLVIEATSWAQVQQSEPNDLEKGFVWENCHKACYFDDGAGYRQGRWKGEQMTLLTATIITMGWVNGVEKGISLIASQSSPSYLISCSKIRAVGRRFVTVGSNLKNVGN